MEARVDLSLQDDVDLNLLDRFGPARC